MAELKKKEVHGDFKNKTGKFIIYLKEESNGTYKVTYLPEQHGWLQESQNTYKENLTLEEASRSYQELETLISL